MGNAFHWTALLGNTGAANVCSQRGADLTNVLEKQRAREARKAARLDAERNGAEMVENPQTEDERLPRSVVGALRMREEARAKRLATTVYFNGPYTLISRASDLQQYGRGFTDPVTVLVLLGKKAECVQALPDNLNQDTFGARGHRRPFSVNDHIWMQLAWWLGE